MNMKKIVKLGMYTLTILLLAGVFLAGDSWAMVMWGAMLLMNIMLLVDAVFEKERDVVLPSVPPLPSPPPPPELAAAPVPPVPPVQPKVVEKPKFICRFCSKEMPDETKLRKHVGMAHYKEIDI